MVCQGYVSVTKSDISYIIHFLLSSLAQISLKTLFLQVGPVFSFLIINPFFIPRTLIVLSYLYPFAEREYL